MRRRRLKIALAVVALVAITLLAMPWWTPWLGRPVARRWGVEFDRYERIGYGRFALHGVRYQKNRVLVTAARAETDTALLWGFRRVFGPGSTIAVDNWVVSVAPLPTSASGVRVAAVGAPAVPEPVGPAPVPPTPRFGPLQLHVLLSRLVERFEDWLPHTTLRSGAVRWPGGGLTLATARWENRQLQLEKLVFLNRTVDGQVAFAGDGAATIQLVHPDLKATVRWTGPEATGDVVFLEQPAKLRAKFEGLSWLPTEANAEALAWTIPAARLGVQKEYGDLQGTARMSWRNNAFDLDASAAAKPLAADGKTPPLEFTAQARGNRSSWRIERFRVVAPFATADLSAPVEVGFDGRTRSGPARFNYNIDLARQTWLPVRGTGSGEILVTGDAGTPFVARFTTALAAVAWRNFTASRIAAAGSLAWPKLDITSLELAIDSETTATAQGGYDIRLKALSGVRARGQVAGAFLARWLPATVKVGKVAFDATASGQIAAIEHGGTLEGTAVQLAELKPLELKGTWKGSLPNTLRADATLKGADLELAAGASIERTRVLVDVLRFAPAGGQELSLSNGPAELAWNPAIKVSNLRLSGGGSRAALDWESGDTGRFTVELAAFDRKWIQGVVPLPGPDWTLKALKSTGGFTRGKLNFNVEAEARLLLEPVPADVSIQIAGDEKGIQLNRLEISDQGQAIATAKGLLPASWDLPSRRLVFDADAPLALEAATDPGSPVWGALGRSFDLEIDRPSAQAKLTGTTRNPAGELRLSFGRLSLQRPELETPLPVVEDLVIAIKGETSAIVLESLSAKVDGQPLQASGRLPMTAPAWRKLVGSPAGFDWKEAELRLDMTDAEIAPIARFAPTYLATQGKLNAHVQLSKGSFTGELLLRDAATRPLAGVGILQDISGHVVLNGRTIEVRRFGGRLGGQEAVISGMVELQEKGPPRYDLTLKAVDVPLVRRVGVFVRSDLNLRVSTDESGAGLVRGSVNLTHALLLADLQDLLPTGERAVSRPPPYFSINIAPFNRWKLAVDVRAAQTINLRTAVFNGVASAHFTLGGTLADPIAVGEATIDEGQVIFPFVNFEVQLGTLRLTAADPFHPEIAVNAVARRFSYDLRLEARGTANAPIVTFSSNPALPADQVRLMVLAGQPPTQELAFGVNRIGRLGTYVGQNLLQGLGATGDRLEISSGEQISEKGRETYKVDYRLGNRLTLFGEYDEFDDVNAGVRFRLFRKGGAGDTGK